MYWIRCVQNSVSGSLLSTHHDEALFANGPEHTFVYFAGVQNFSSSRLEVGVTTSDIYLHDATVAPEISNP